VSLSRFVKSQKSAALIYTVVEACSGAYKGSPYPFQECLYPLPCASTNTELCSCTNFTLDYQIWWHLLSYPILLWDSLHSH